MQRILFAIVFIITALLIMTGCASKPPIINAAGSGDISTVKKLYAEGRNINEADSSGATALMYAIWSNKADVAKYLIASGADIKAKDINGYDALSYAAGYGQLEIIKRLIDKGADIETKDLSGKTPLVNAAYELPRTADVMKLLIKSGADINAKCSEGETVLDIALSFTQGDVIDALTRNGVNLWTPEAGKSRLFFVGTELWDFLAITVDKQTKKLNQVYFMGLAFIDVDSGKHDISIIDTNSSRRAKPISSIDAIAGQTYYFEVKQDMKRRAAHYVGINLSSAVITPLSEVEAKQKVKEILAKH